MNYIFLHDVEQETFDLIKDALVPKLKARLNIVSCTVPYLDMQLGDMKLTIYRKHDHEVTNAEKARQENYGLPG